jgi:hypothetical protein
VLRCPVAVVLGIIVHSVTLAALERHSVFYLPLIALSVATSPPPRPPTLCGATGLLGFAVVIVSITITLGVLLRRVVLVNNLDLLRCVDDQPRTATLFTVSVVTNTTNTCQYKHC